MATAISETTEFKRLMKTVGILRTHYSTLADMAEAAMLTSRLRGEISTANHFASLLDRMADEHRKALRLIGDKLTTPEELRKTRRALRAAADEAHDFVQSLRNTKLTLEKFTNAANFLSGLLANLKSILV